MSRPMRRVELLANHVAALPVDTAIADVSRVCRPAYLYQEVLKKACVEAKAALAVYWVYDKFSDSLRLAGYHNPRDHQVKDQFALDTRYMEESQPFEVMPGFGAVGRVHKTRRPEIYEANEKHPCGTFINAGLIEKFGIESVCFTPFLNGVLEFGVST